MSKANPFGEAEAISESTSIILRCDHEGRKTSEVNLGGGRGIVWCCCECWNASVAARRAEDRARREQAMERGRAYWAARGIAVGETVGAFAQSMFGIGGLSLRGVAKVGKAGAYVASKAQPGQLAPEYWHKLE